MIKTEALLDILRNMTLTHAWCGELESYLASAGVVTFLGSLDPAERCACSYHRGKWMTEPRLTMISGPEELDPEVVDGLIMKAYDEDALDYHDMGELTIKLKSLIKV